MKKLLIFMIILLSSFFFVSCKGKEYNINIEQVTGGTIETNYNKAKTDTLIIVTINPDSDYKYLDNSLKVNGEAVDGKSFKMPSNDVTISCEFESLNYEKDVIQYRDNVSNNVAIYKSKEFEQCEGLLVFVHGGFWVAGSSDMFDDICIETVTNYNNYIACTMEYRLLLSLENGYFDMIEDIRSCLNKLYSYFNEKEIEINKCSLIGHSSGGHTSLLYSYKYNDANIKVDTVCECAGVSSFDDPNILRLENSALLNILEKLTLTTTREECLSVLPEISPINYCNNNVKTVLCHCPTDPTVPYSNSVLLKQKLEELGKTYDFYSVPELGHTFVNSLKYMKIVVQKTINMMKLDIS